MPSMTKEQLEQSGIADSKTVCNLRCSCQTRDTKSSLGLCPANGFHGPTYLD